MSKKKYTLTSMAKEVLDSVKLPLEPSQIWDIGVRDGLDKKIETKFKDKDNRKGRIQVIRSHLSSGVEGIHRTEGRPAKFYTEISEDGGDETDDELLPQDNEHRNEREIHPVLAHVANNDLLGGDKKIWTQTVRHENSRKKEKGDWLHPDMVGVYMPTWNSDDFAEFGKTLAGRDMLVLYSFEIKWTITGSNYRESFFQAVSNSSWANEGYLVALTIKETRADLMLDLERLSSAFGIGVMQLLDAEGNLSQNPILHPAKRKDQLDWVTMDKLARLNAKNFGAFLQRVKKDFQSHEISEGKYDKIEKDIESYIRNSQLVEKAER